MSRSFVTLVAGVVMTAALAAQGGQPSILGPKLEAKPTVADAIPGVVAAGEKVALIHDGLKGSDAIVGLPDGTAVFIEQNSPRIVRINADDTLSTLLEEPATTRALGVDSKGRLLGLVLSTSAVKADHVRVLYGPGAGTVLATGVEGKPLFQANDFVITKKDAIYMTDAGTLMKPALSEPTWIYHLPPGGTPKRVADKIVMPNGIGLSPDDRTLYVNDSRGDYLLAFDVDPSGSLSNRRNFAKYEFDEEMRKTFPYLADALCVDADGRVYVAMPLSVQVFSPNGEFLGRIPVTKKVQNLAFAGQDRRSLFIVAQGSIWKVRTLSRGPGDRAK
jgi:gluconolactonase